MLDIRQKSGQDFGLLPGLRQVLQRAGVPVPQVLRLLGLQQRRPPGAHLPLHDRRGRREHVGLRRHDELLQRHHEVEGDVPHRRQPRRGASRLAAAPAQGQGAEQRGDDRVRSALHAHGRARHRVRALPPRHGHRADLGHPLAHLRERLGGQGVHPQARLGHGLRARGSEEVDARGDRERSRACPARSCAASPRRSPPTSPAPSSGAWAARSTRSATPTCAPTASCSWRSATWAWRAAAPTSSAATTTCRAPPTSASSRARCPATTASRRAPGSTGRASGTCPTTGCSPASRTRS